MWGRKTGAQRSAVYGDPLEHPQKESFWGNVNPIAAVGVDKFSGVPPNSLARDRDAADFGQPQPARVVPTRTVNRGNIQVRYAI